MTETEIHKICRKYEIIDYTINNDMSVNVDETVNLTSTL